MQKKESKFEFVKTLAIALICAGFIRSFFFEPFHIPSSSMKPNLLIGDYLFVSKYSYGFSRYSFPFGFNLFSGRFWKFSEPQRGDVIVFRLPTNPKINYIKRLIGLPGDEIKMENGALFINGKKVKKVFDGTFVEENSLIENEINKFVETLPNAKEITVLDQRKTEQDDAGPYLVPAGHYFFMGDNRDNSQDSRFLDHVGFVAEENLVGRANIIFLSSATPIWQIWKWPNNFRFNRFFKKID